MDLIVAACRALANRSRLQLLRMVHEHPGITVQTLAEEADLSITVVSKHLKLLRELHLVQMKPRGRTVRCSPPSDGSTRNAFLNDLQNLLRTVLGAGDVNCTLAKVCDSSRAANPGWPEVYDALVAQFTAFTHLRRLLILRWLAQRGTGRPEELVAAIRMSPDAARRHLDKLRRRGVAEAEAGATGSWTIRRTAGSSSRRQLLETVLRALRRV